MKNINVTFEDDKHKELVNKKSNMSWKDFIYRSIMESDKTYLNDVWIVCSKCGHSYKLMDTVLRKKFIPEKEIKDIEKTNQVKPTSTVWDNISDKRV